MLEPLSPVVTEEQTKEIAERFGTPVYVYSQKLLEEQADKTLDFPNAFGLTVRYAMKANPNQNFLRIFDKKGICIDASSGYEAERAIRAGIKPNHILLTSQEIPNNLEELVKRGVEYNACSLNQLGKFGCLFPGRSVSVRINPGLGSGGTKRTNTGGPSSSFGIWHERISEIFKIAKAFNLGIYRMHTHIGSGSDPEVWKKVALMSLNNVLKFIKEGYEIDTLNLGGGYKVGRMNSEKSTDLQDCGKPVVRAFEDFADKTGRELGLEIEPGTFLVANSGCLVARVIDVKETPGYNFIVVDSGMTEITRPALYGAQHPISIIPASGLLNDSLSVIVSGHCCESGDILTPKEGDPESLQPRKLPFAYVDDLAVIGGAGAYCSGMSCKNYNSHPEAAEVLIDRNGKSHLIRKRQTLKQIVQNEVRL